MADKEWLTWQPESNVTTTYGTSSGTTSERSTAQEPDEGERFTDLTRGLLSVPKSELDEKRKQDS